MEKEKLTQEEEKFISNLHPKSFELEESISHICKKFIKLHSKNADEDTKQTVQTVVVFSLSQLYFNSLLKCIDASFSETSVEDFFLKTINQAAKDFVEMKK